MSLENARNHLKKFGKDARIQELGESSATVELAAAALGVEPARIAKTLSFRVGDGAVLVLTAGDAKIDNHKYKELFKCKARMLSPEELDLFVGHPAGGVCPFGIKDASTKVFTDISLKRFKTVFPACGTPNSAIELNCGELFECAGSSGWIDVCKNWQEG